MLELRQLHDQNVQSNCITGKLYALGMAHPWDLDYADRLRHSTGAFTRRVLAAAAIGDAGELEVLAYLRRDGAMSVAELARRRGIRHQSMSQIVATAFSRGLVAKTPDVDDARRVLIDLTGAGVELVDRSRAERTAAIEKAARAVLSDDERAVLAQVPELLDRLSTEIAGEHL
ncbi:MarR family winged helix-turn-helix transcriptional regulator [Rhodococcus opacus]|uniref:MarR family winged helix-turn-helix transcriptional regulator n=1 Tax=Rhodococcus opacus TaxID=37919 RepID=UPI002475EC1D|nr:MarR family transcriptional regulator [Rhodococcus opacus]MDH6293413.1 DNA-binding MarR family transcriptional regulator [Rhodococcus opacus]